MGILDLLRRDEAPNAAALGEAVAKAETEAVATAAKLQELTRARAAALLGEDDAALDRIEGELTQAQRHADRLDLAAAELRRRLEQARADERRAELERIHAKGEAARRRAVELVHGEYRKHAVALLRVVRELVELDAEVTAANEKLMATGYESTVPAIDREARPVPNGSINLGCYPVWTQLVLPSSEHPYHFLWPGMDVFGTKLQENWRPTR